MRAHACVCACVCVLQIKESARRMASMTSDSSDTSSKQQQAYRKEIHNSQTRGSCHQLNSAILTEEKEKQFTKSMLFTVYLFQDLD